MSSGRDILVFLQSSSVDGLLQSYLAQDVWLHGARLCGRLALATAALGAMRTAEMAHYTTYRVDEHLAYLDYTSSNYYWHLRNWGIDVGDFSIDSDYEPQWCM